MIIECFILVLLVVVGMAASLPADEPDMTFLGVNVDRNTHAVTFTFGTPKRDVVPVEYDIVIVKADRKISQIIAAPYLELVAFEGGVNNYPEELQVSNDQKEKVITASAEAMRDLTELGKLLRKKEVSDRDAKMRANDFADRVHRMKSDLFLDFQIERIEQVQFSIMLHLDGLLKGFESKLIRDRFSITDEQLRAMKRKRPQLEDEFEKEAYELREKYRARILANLTPDQRKKLKEIGGEIPTRTSQSENLMESFKWDLFDFQPVP